MKALIAIILLLFSFGCAPTPNVEWKTLGVVNGCEVNAFGYQAAYAASYSQAKWYWTKVLVIIWNGDLKLNGHALCVVNWNERIWAYDQTQGSWALTPDLTLKSDPTALASLWTGDRSKFRFAFFQK